MPLKIDSQLPAYRVLRDEAVPLISEGDAQRQDIRPLRVALLNLMPEKIRTETQIARLLGQSPIQIDLSLIRLSSHHSKTVSADHMNTFYRRWQDVKQQRFDGLVITGAPIEHLPFEEVSYWQELKDILDWSQTHVIETMDICWGAQAALWHFHRVPKYTLAAKLFGIYKQTILQHGATQMRGLNDQFRTPVSRYTEVRQEDLPPTTQVLAASPATGLCVVDDRPHRHTYIFNHFEYDSDTLANEYRRDIARGLATALPANTFPNDDPTAEVVNIWRSSAHLFFRNWTDLVYANAPYEWVNTEAGDSEHG